jgi:hypothetical protein
MASNAAVPQIYDDWAASCEVQQRFMQNPSQPLVLGVDKLPRELVSCSGTDGWLRVGCK